MSISKLSTEELLTELNRRGLMTNSKTNEIVLSNPNKTVKIILSYGLPEKTMECRECRQHKSSENFGFYQSRVDANGYLMRSNALCNVCSKVSNKQRKEVLDKALIPEKPKSGDICPNCERSWNGNWHRHHVEDDFISYLCGHCNMSFSDQRTKINLINENKENGN